MAEPTPPPGTDTKSVPILYTFPHGVDARVATEAIVQHSRDMFVLSFFEEYIPILLGTDAERREKLKTIDGIEARCVGRVRMTPREAKRLAKALTENVANFEKKSGAVAE